MRIDLNDPAQFTKENVALLIASEEDDRDWQLRVTSEGIAYLSSVVGADRIEGLAFRCETWIEGNGYVGKEAAADESWVRQVYADLRRNWPNPTDSYIG
jgi:hypothetical protein